MKVTLDFGTNRCRVQRENGPKIWSESAFWYAIKKELIAQGHDVIKKLMCKDGHLVSEHIYYVRTRKPPTDDRRDVSHFMLHDGSYAITMVYETYNRDDRQYVDLDLMW